MIGRLQFEARNLIGRNRRSFPMKVLHSAATFIESAYANEGADVSRNGELHLIKVLRPAGMKVAFDVGANFGDWSIDALSAWPGCHVHSFEVAPPTFKELETRIGKSGNSARATLNCFGLSNLDGALHMYYFPDHPELTCDISRHDGYKEEIFEATLITGDRYAREKGISYIDFLKIDVEGAEYKVFNGLSGFLNAQKVACLQFEYGAFSTQTRVLLSDYYAMLSERYWLGKIYPTYIEFREYDWRMEDFRFSNYCGVSKARPDLKRLLS